MVSETFFICSAYESGYGHCGDDLCNPYQVGSPEHEAYQIGKAAGAERGYKPHSPDPIQAEWCPIDTAPKDGRLIQLTDGEHRYMARWESIDRCWQAWPMSAVPGRMTHWAPALPLPPNDLANSRPEGASS